MQSKKKLPLSKGWYSLEMGTVLLLSIGVGVGVGGHEEAMFGSDRLGLWSTSGSTSIGTLLKVASLFTCIVPVGKSSEGCSWVGLWWWCELCCEQRCLV